MNTENLKRKNSEPRLSNKFENLFSSCGINPKDINPKLLGRGGNHKVYRFRDGKRVIKVPINQHIGTVSSASEEQSNIALYLQYFSGFSVPTFFLDSPVGYCVVMDYVYGRLMTQDDVYESDTVNSGRLSTIGEQLRQIITDNQRLMEDTGKMMDLVGLEGLIGAIGALRPNSQPAHLTNVRIENGKLRIVDYDLVAFRDLRNPLDKAKALFALQLNQQVLLHHFKLPYSKKN